MNAEVRRNATASVVLVILVLVMLWLGHPPVTSSQSPSMERESIANRWRPRQAVQNSRYVGSEACGKCHTTQAASYRHSAMNNALELVTDGQILRSRPRLTLASGTFTYQIVRKGNTSIYSVTAGTNTISEPILYAFGQGQAGQTYIISHNGVLYESRVSFFNEIGNLDWTIGYPRSVPLSLDEAIGHAMTPTDQLKCFGCHSTAAVNGLELQLDRLMPGVGCEACHGPGEKHVTSMKSGKSIEKTYIFDPSRLSPDDLSQEFCGSCHRGVEEVMSLPQRAGINNVRFQPYRISTSPGHDPNDPRLSCTACHNPHEPPQRKAAFYDAKCTACHGVVKDKTTISAAPMPTKVAETDQGTARACPVGSVLCVTCHMPKVELLGAHYKFTDHRIRIAKPNDPYPN